MGYLCLNFASLPICAQKKTPLGVICFKERKGKGKESSGIKLEESI